jgi:hypothetical protein
LHCKEQARNIPYFGQNVNDSLVKLGILLDFPLIFSCDTSELSHFQNMRQGFRPLFDLLDQGVPMLNTMGHQNCRSAFAGRQF